MDGTYRALGADARQYYKLLETLPLIVYSVEPTPPYAPIYISPGVEILGYTREEWLAVPDQWIRAIHPADRERVLAASEHAFRSGQPLDDEYRLIARDGSVRWVHDRGSFVLDEGGDAVQWRGIMVDVTARKEAELARAASEEQYRRMHEVLNGTLALLEATIESTTEGMLVVDRHGGIVRMNRKFVELWHLPEEILAMRDDARAIAFVLDQLADPEGFVRKVHELYSEPEAESFDVLQFKDGRVYERSSKPQRVAGTVVGRVWSFRDVTARLQLEAQLRQSHKMEAIGALAGGVAHDFNNVLTVIRGHVEMLMADARLAEDQRADLAQVYDAAERAMRLTRQLLAFSRKQMMHPVVLDLTAVVREIEPMLRRLIGEDIVISVTECDDARILADRAQLEQILLNLVVNARDAMPDGGTISIAIQHHEEGEDRCISGGATIPAGSYVSLRVRDTGQGIPSEWRDRIFEPFFTTKDDRHGTGLGLATVYGIVKQSNSFIEVESDVDAGTTFTILFPLAQDQATARRSTEVAVVPRGTETILVVEDEEAVRRFVQRALTQGGFTVIAAGNAAEALELARRNTDTIDVVLSDVVMPGMGGTQLVQELRDLGITAPVIYMTGYTDDEMIRRGVVQSRMFVLQKPFTRPELISAVQRLLRAARKGNGSGMPPERPRSPMRQDS